MLFLVIVGLVLGQESCWAPFKVKNATVFPFSATVADDLPVFFRAEAPSNGVFRFKGVRHYTRWYGSYDEHWNPVYGDQAVSLSFCLYSCDGAELNWFKARDNLDLRSWFTEDASSKDCYIWGLQVMRCLPKASYCMESNRDFDLQFVPSHVDPSSKPPSQSSDHSWSPTQGPGQSPAPTQGPGQSPAPTLRPGESSSPTPSSSHSHSTFTVPSTGAPKDSESWFPGFFDLPRFWGALLVILGVALLIVVLLVRRARRHPVLREEAQVFVAPSAPLFEESL